jgi:ketosteroid isomerase-like protein
MEKDLKKLTLAYLDAVGKKDFRRVEQLLAPDLRFTGPASSRDSAQDFIGALKRLGAIHVRNEPTRVFVDGDEVCVIYDFVTDTPAGALPAIEWLRFEGERIRSINLYYDRVPWKGVMDEIGRRTAQPTV